MEIKTISTLDELPPLSAGRCDLTPEEIAKKSVDRFNDLATAKYMAGQDEHANGLLGRNHQSTRSNGYGPGQPNQQDAEKRQTGAVEQHDAESRNATSLLNHASRV